MKQALILLLFTLATHSLFACLSASQNRLFPLGETSKGLCAVETHLYRTELGGDTDEFKPAWGGISYFKIYDKDYKEVYAEIIDTIRLFKQDHYDSIIGGTFKKGLRLAEKYPDFIAAKPVTLTFCNYQETCSKASLLFDTINNKISIRLPSKINHDVKVLFDTASIASSILGYYSGFDDIDLSAKSFKGDLYINSVRQLQIGNKKLTVVHIGRGQTSHLAEGGKEYEPKFAFTDINKSVFEEPVLHHGQGFDFYIWE